MCLPLRFPPRWRCPPVQIAAVDSNAEIPGLVCESKLITESESVRALRMTWAVSSGLALKEMAFP